MTSFLQTIDIGLRSSIFTKFEDILGLTNVNRGVILYPKEIAFRMISEKKGAAISEFINVWRTRTAPSWERQRTPVARRGIRLAHTNANKTSTITVKAMPVELDYSVWFWTKDIENLNLIAERYLFWQQDNPNLNLFYNSIYPAELDLHFGELTDESNVPEMLNRGNHFCMHVPIKIDGWVFASENIGTVQKIELVLYDNTNLSDYRKCIFETDQYDVDIETALRLYEEHIFAIIEVDTVANSFHIKDDSGTSLDDIAGEFVTDSCFYVDDSTGNDGKYTIVSASDEVDYVEIVVSETIEDSTGDGVISLRNI